MMCISKIFENARVMASSFAQDARIFSVFLAILLSCGCDHSSREQELIDYIAEVKSKSIGQIESLPEVKPYETFIYSAENLRSPFTPTHPEEVLVDLPADNGIRPDTHRRREELENYPLDSLRMLGTLEKEHHIWAIILDSDGAVHRVRKGNYIGQNHGKVIEVTEEKVNLKEIVPDGRGGWLEKDASMALIEE